MSDEFERFWQAERSDASLETLLKMALDEDAARADVATEALFGDEATAGAVATMTAKQSGIFCGGPAALKIGQLLSAHITEIERVSEGTALEPGQVVLKLAGPIQALLSSERTILNLVAHLSGIATRTRDLVDKAGPIGVYDTRKTLPGLRRLQKYAVRVGGGLNHRMDLAEFPILKENHRELYRARFLGDTWSAEEEIQELIRSAKACPRAANRPLQIEVEDYESLSACVRLGVELILIDNQPPETISEWIAQIEKENPQLAENREWRQRLEASGGINRDNLAAYAESGVGRVSLGALTHSVLALDLSMRIEWGDSYRASSPGS